jgi:hypothetical protein
MQQIRQNVEESMKLFHQRIYINKVLIHNHLMIEQEEGTLPKFIVEIKDGFAKMPIKYANYILGSKHNLYRLVIEEGWYLPKEESRCCNTKYLFDVMSGRIFRIQQNNVKSCFGEKLKWSKLDILSYLQSKYLGGMEFGFSVENLPNREWLVNILFTYEPSHELFTGSGEIEKLVEIPIK